MLRADGYLPLTSENKYKLRLMKVAITSLMPLGLVSFAIAITLISDGHESSGGPLVVVALCLLTAGVLGYIHVVPRYGPTGAVYPPPLGYSDKVVELRRVHPGFVIAVQQYQQAQASGGVARIEVD